MKRQGSPKTYRLFIHEAMVQKDCLALGKEEKVQRESHDPDSGSKVGRRTTRDIEGE